MNRERQERWDAAHLRTASTKLRSADYAALQQACEDRGITVYALIHQLLRDFLAQENPFAADAVVVSFRR